MYRSHLRCYRNPHFPIAIERLLRSSDSLRSTPISDPRLTRSPQGRTFRHMFPIALHAATPIDADSSDSSPFSPSHRFSISDRTLPRHVPTPYDIFPPSGSSCGGSSGLHMSDPSTTPISDRAPSRFDQLHMVVRPFDSRSL